MNSRSDRTEVCRNRGLRSSELSRHVHVFPGRIASSYTQAPTKKQGGAKVIPKSCWSFSGPPRLEIKREIMLVLPI